MFRLPIHLKDALDFASDKHAGQLALGWYPYYHPVAGGSLFTGAGL